MCIFYCITEIDHDEGFREAQSLQFCQVTKEKINVNKSIKIFIKFLQYISEVNSEAINEFYMQFLSQKCIHLLKYPWHKPKLQG